MQIVAGNEDVSTSYNSSTKVEVNKNNDSDRIFKELNAHKNQFEKITDILSDLQRQISQTNDVVSTQGNNGVESQKIAGKRKAEQQHFQTFRY